MLTFVDGWVRVGRPLCGVPIEPPSLLLLARQRRAQKPRKANKSQGRARLKAKKSQARRLRNAKESQSKPRKANPLSKGWLFRIDAGSPTCVR